MYIYIYIERERERERERESERAIYIAPYFMLLRLNPFDFSVDREG